MCNYYSSKPHFRERRVLLNLFRFDQSAQIKLKANSVAWSLRSLAYKTVSNIILSKPGLVGRIQIIMSFSRYNYLRSKFALRESWPPRKDRQRERVLLALLAKEAIRLSELPVAKPPPLPLHHHHPQNVSRTEPA